MMKRVLAALLCASMILGCSVNAFAFTKNSFGDTIEEAAPYVDDDPEISYLNFSSSGAYNMTNGEIPVTGDRFRLQATYQLTADAPSSSKLGVTFDPDTGKVRSSGGKTLNFQKAKTLSQSEINVDLKQDIKNVITLGETSIKLKDNRKYIAEDDDGIYVYDQAKGKVITVDNEGDISPDNADYTLESLFTDYYVTVTIPITVTKRGSGEYEPDLQARVYTNHSSYLSRSESDYVSIFVYTDEPKDNVICEAKSSSSSSPSGSYDVDGTAEYMEDAVELFEDGADHVEVELEKGTISAKDVRGLKEAMDDGDTLIIRYDDLMVVFSEDQVARFPNEAIDLRYSDSRVSDVNKELKKRGIDCDFLAFTGVNSSRVKGDIHFYTYFYDRVYVYSIAQDGEQASFLKTAYVEGDEVMLTNASLGNYFFTEEKLTASELKAVNEALSDDTSSGSSSSSGSITLKPSGSITLKPSGSSSSSLVSSGSVSGSAMTTKITSSVKTAVKNGQDTVQLVYSYSGASIPATVVQALQKAYSESEVNVKLYLQTKSGGKVQNQYLLQGKYVYTSKAFKPEYSTSKLPNGDVKLTIGEKGKSMGTLTYVASKLDQSGLNTSKLTLLKQDTNGKYSKIPRSCTVDSKGYFHFSVLNGGTYIITDTPNSYLK